MTKNNNEKLNGWTILLFIIVLIALFIILALSIRSDTNFANANEPYPSPTSPCTFTFSEDCKGAGGCPWLEYVSPITHYTCYIYVKTNDGRELDFFEDGCVYEGICVYGFIPGMPVLVYRIEGTTFEILKVNIYLTPAKNRWLPEVIKEEEIDEN